MSKISGKTSDGKIITISVDDDGHLQIDNLELRIFGQTEEEVILPILVDDDGKIITSTNGDGEVTASSCFIETIEYTGDGSTSLVVSLVDTELIVKDVLISKKVTTDYFRTAVFHSTDKIVDDHVNGVAFDHSFGDTPVTHTIQNRIIAMGTGSFTVDDGGSNADPNASGVVYNARVLGVHAVA